MKSKSRLFPILLVLTVSLLAGCDSITTGGSDDRIIASGVIEADEISIAAEISGKIAEVNIQEGSSVKAGDLLFIMEDDLLLKQKEQALAVYESTLAQRKGSKAGVQAAHAAMEAAEATLAAVEIQYDQVLAIAQSLYENNRVNDWNQNTASQVNIPSWYFQQEELISAAEIEVSNAWDFYHVELIKLQDKVSEIDSQDFSEAENRLAEAQAAFEVADLLKDHRIGYEGREYLEDFVETIFDKAETELEAAQKAYDQVLANSEYEEILEARARVSVAKERYDLAQNSLNNLFQGEYSLEVQAAKALVAQAEAGLLQTRAQVALAETSLLGAATAVQQAETALDLVDLQLEKLQVHSPISGVVLTSIIKPGEIIAAGLTAVSVGDLTELSVTVYLPEDKYGQVNLGDIAKLSIDSYPEDIFEAVVVRIADQAEYTPRNVQTQEERQNTVYAVKLSVKNPTGKLKPGMPADVEFQP
jgi:multidrug resistance efflux pump